MVGQLIVAIPKYSKGKLQLIAKNRKGQQFKSKVEALEDPRSSTPNLLSPPGTTDKKSVATGGKTKATKEIKEWQAIMDHLRTLPAKKGELPVIPVDGRAAEVRAIKA
jgi:5'-nucleotidase